MSRKLQFVTAVLILSSLSLGTLNALPLHPAQAFGHEECMLVAMVDWVAALFSLDRSHAKAPRHSRSKVAAQLDPDGSH
ncbi:MAG: hypothetical protein ACJ76Y_31265 [Thermoanaerobaculia bacterium]